MSVSPMQDSNSQPSSEPSSSALTLENCPRIEWNDELWEAIRENLLRVQPLPSPDTAERAYIESKPTRRMLLEMISILDGMERLTSLAERETLNDNPILENWLTSIRGLQRRMGKALEKLDVRPIPCLGRPFDAHLHEVVEVRKDTQYPPGTVIEVREKPYRWGRQTLRVGKVVVTPKPPKDSTSF
jgi:hypothetical protein